MLSGHDSLGFFFEKCYDNLLLIVDYTRRQLLHAVCRLMKSFTNSAGKG